MVSRAWIDCLIRPPTLGTFEHLLTVVDVPIRSLVRLSHFPETEPYWAKSASHRFDDPTSVSGRAGFGVLYLADSLETAFCESVIHDASLFNAVNGHYEAPANEFLRELAFFHPPLGPSLPMVSLVGDDLKRLGLNADLCTGDDYTLSQQWAKAIHDAAPMTMGIRYGSRQRNEASCYAVFERSELSLSHHLSMTSGQKLSLCSRFGVIPV